MANRLKVVCKSVKNEITEWENGKMPPKTETSQEVVLLVGSGSFTFSPPESFEFQFESGREYYVDFCKVIAPRTEKESPALDKVRARKTLESLREIAQSKIEPGKSEIENVAGGKNLVSMTPQCAIELVEDVLGSDPGF